MSDNNVPEAVEEEKKAMRVRVVKMKSGEEIVTAIEGVSDEDGVRNYLCLDPAFPATDPQDPTRMKFMPWVMFAADREFIISRADMMCEPKKVDEKDKHKHKRRKKDAVTWQEREKERDQLSNHDIKRMFEYQFNVVFNMVPFDPL